MKFGNKVLTSIISMSMLAGNGESECPSNYNYSSIEPKNERISGLENNTREIPNLLEIQNKTKKQTAICLTTDDEKSFTYKKVLESITDPENTILEFPVSPLFEKYGNHPHPLAVRGIKKDFRALLGKNGIEDLSSKIPQKLSHRAEKVTSDTQYEVGDTIRFQLIDPALKGVFPKYLSDQLKEDGFQTFSNPDSSSISKNFNSKENSREKSDFIYDIVVKKLPTGEGVLALYRNGELFMSTYVSVGLNTRKTKTGQFEILGTNPYYFSRKYKSPMPGGVYYDEGGRWFHQGNVTKFPASHGCVRQPGIQAMILFSSIKGANRGDVFISNNLYK